MPPPSTSHILLDPRSLALLGTAIAAFGLFRREQKEQKPGESMSLAAKFFLGIGVSAAVSSAVMFAVTLDVFGHAMRTYTGLPPFRQGLLLGVCGTMTIEGSLLLIWTIYIRGKRRREAASAARVPLSVFNIAIKFVEENNEISFLVHNLSDPVRLQGFIHPDSGVEGWPEEERTLAVWGGDHAEQVVSIGRGDKKRLVVGRREGDGRYSDRRSGDERADRYQYFLAFREEGGAKRELPTVWMKKDSYPASTLAVTVNITLVAEFPVVRTLSGYVLLHGEKVWPCSRFMESA